MLKNRLEAFSDGVLAIIITIMVLELKAPHEPELEALRPMLPVALSYLLSFVYVGIYWNNHHHMFHAAKHVTGGILWANLHLLFWLSLIPFVTDWMGATHFAPMSLVLYGAVLALSGLAYLILQRAIIAQQGKDSVLARAVGKDLKGKISFPLYLLAMGLAFVHPALSGVIYVGVAAMWIIPDRRIERTLAENPAAE